MVRRLDRLFPAVALLGPIVLILLVTAPAAATQLTWTVDNAQPEAFESMLSPAAGHGDRDVPHATPSAIGGNESDPLLVAAGEHGAVCPMPAGPATLPLLTLAVAMLNAPFLLRWGKVELLIRSILATTWDDTTWPDAQRELEKALQMRSSLARGAQWN